MKVTGNVSKMEGDEKDSNERKASGFCFLSVGFVHLGGGANSM